MNLILADGMILGPGDFKNYAKDIEAQMESGDFGFSALESGIKEVHLYNVQNRNSDIREALYAIYPIAYEKSGLIHLESAFGQGKEDLVVTEMVKVVKL